jgi:hypothetical protein
LNKAKVCFYKNEKKREGEKKKAPCVTTNPCNKAPQTHAIKKTQERRFVPAA